MKYSLKNSRPARLTRHATYRVGVVVAALLLVLALTIVAGIRIGEHYTPLKERVAAVKQPTPSVEKTPTAPVITPVTMNILHKDIITTFFFAGEPADADNGYINNVESAWLDDWKTAFGGYDNPNERNGYYPKAFIPKENPFYFALPYNDFRGDDVRRDTAKNCLTVSGNQATGYSWCKNVWIKISYGDKVAYAQWEDVGPFETDDVDYVFGNKPPRNTDGASAGLDVSPAVTTYLGLNGLNKTSWQFVLTKDVPDGPWKQIITTSPGRAATR